MILVAGVSWKKEIADLFPRALWDEPMSRHTTFKIGGPADCFLEIKSTAELKKIFAWILPKKIPYFMLGWGSNLLVREGGIRGLVLQLKGEFNKIKALKDSKIYAGAAVRLPRLVTFCAARGLAGSEPLVGVPGSVGGAVVMNAGTREGEIGDLVETVSVYDIGKARLVEKEKSELDFKYRRSNLQGQVILGATLWLRSGSKVDIITKIQELQKKRLRTQPVHTFNVGSIFKNPLGNFVAKLIEEAGFKGVVQGGVRVSPLHANFIENFDGGRAQDVLDLVEKIKTKVMEMSGIDLELEVKVVGEA